MNVWPLGIYFVAVILIVGGMIAGSYFLGEHHCDPATGEPYESGILSFGSAHLRLSAKFYLVALFFVIFDLEAVFVFAWSVALFRVGWTGYIEMFVFVAVLLASFAYLWRVGALDWSES